MSRRTLFCVPQAPHPNKDWVDHVVKPFEGFVQLVSLHCYPFYPSFQDPALMEKEYYQFLGLVDLQAKTLIQNMKQMIGETKVNISFDEWNAWYSWYRPCSVCEGIFVASMLHMIMRESEKMRIQLACHFQAVNEGAIRVEPDRAFLTPSGQMMAIMQNHANGRCLTMERDLVATEKDHIITVTMINRSYDTKKFFCFPYRGTILACKLYTSEDITPPSTFTLQDVQPVIAENRIELTLAPHSVFFFQMESRDDIEKGEQ